VRQYALQVAGEIGLSQELTRILDYSALLHDIGKLGIKESILTKPDRLSADEYEEVKCHPVIGSRLVTDIEFLDMTAPIIYSHHEFFDGQGYPRGLRGEEIPLESRIIAVADAFEAMTSDRPYRKAFNIRVALDRLQEAAGRQFDAGIVDVFIRLFQESAGPEGRNES
jgi:HD-GYP domain-containing protein (c-di-GMP phosphodiesterase class II)